MTYRRLQEPLSREAMNAEIRRVNQSATGPIPLVNCAACGLPIEDEFVLDGRFDPPRWTHATCDRDEP